jgi:hypothetical protein
MEIKRNYSCLQNICILILLTMLQNLAGQEYAGLHRLDEGPIPTFYSEGARTVALETVTRCQRARTYFTGLFGHNPPFKLLILSKTDWQVHTDEPTYGMPFARLKDSALVVAAENNDWWASSLPDMKTLPDSLRKRIFNTYSDRRGNVDLRPFFELLVLHEVGHAYHYVARLSMQRQWLEEFFATLMLHTYIEEQEPELSLVLNTLPKIRLSLADKTDLPYTTLQQLENNYEKISPKNYAWYQQRLHLVADKLYKKAGLAGLKNLWRVLKEHKEPLDDRNLIRLLGQKVHPVLADIFFHWDE